MDFRARKEKNWLEKKKVFKSKIANSLKIEQVYPISPSEISLKLDANSDFTKKKKIVYHQGNTKFTFKNINSSELGS